MFRIRFHGRGGQGMKTASRILGTAFFRAGYEVQDAPRYAAERRGAPIFAYVRAAREVIHERGVIRSPDLVIVADETLVPLPAAAVMAGVDGHTTLLIVSLVPASEWHERLAHAGRILTLPPLAEGARHADIPLMGPACAGAAARLLGLPWDVLAAALSEELAGFGAAVLEFNLSAAELGFAAMQAEQGSVAEGPELEPLSAVPDWIVLDLEGVERSAPAIHAAATSVEVRTGLWRTLRPVIDAEHCHHCWWICSSLCPDGVIAVIADGPPQIDYDHCKGCMVCVAVCPHHAITAHPEATMSPNDARA